MDELNENLKSHDWAKPRGVEGQQLRLKNYRLRKQKRREPGLPKNPYLKKTFARDHREKLAAEKKRGEFKSFKLFKQSELNFDEIEVMDAEMAQMYSDDDYTTDNDEIVKSQIVLLKELDNGIKQLMAGGSLLNLES